MAKRPPLTHFLCIPFLSQASRPQFENASNKFRDKLRNLPQPLDPDLLGRAIRPVGTIHLTLGVMSLTEQERVDEAIEFLNDLDLTNLLAAEESYQNARPKEDADSTTDAMIPQPAKDNIQSAGAAPKPPQSPPIKQFTITISSLKTMKPASKTSVLYAEPTDATNRLLPFCEQLRARFTESGYLQPENRPLKLHATVLNTLYASNKGRKGPRNRKPMLIDATELIQQCEDFSWAEDVVLEKVAICEMGAKKVEVEGGSVDERYTEVASKVLPT